MTDLFTLTVGEGMLILTMHGGLGLDHTYMAPHFDPLTEHGQVVYYDHRGNGRSPAPNDFADLTMGRLVADAAALVDSLTDAPIVLIGHSYGGFVAQEFAIAHPDKLRGLVLINTVPALDYQPSLSGTAEQMGAMGKIFTQPMTSDAEWQENWGLYSQMLWAEFDPERSSEIDAATTYSYQAWNQGMANLASYNTLEGLADVDVPTLVISGESDGLTPTGPGAERIVAALPSAELLVVEEAGHFTFIEDGGQTISAISGFIEGLE